MPVIYLFAGLAGDIPHRRSSPLPNILLCQPRHRKIDKIRKKLFTSGKIHATNNPRNQITLYIDMKKIYVMHRTTKNATMYVTMDENNNISVNSKFTTGSFLTAKEYVGPEIKNIAVATDELAAEIKERSTWARPMSEDLAQFCVGIRLLAAAQNEWFMQF